MVESLPSVLPVVKPLVDLVWRGVEPVVEAGEVGTESETGTVEKATVVAGTVEEATVVVGTVVKPSVVVGSVVKLSVVVKIGEQRRCL